MLKKHAFNALAFSMVHLEFWKLKPCRSLHHWH